MFRKSHTDPLDTFWHRRLGPKAGGFALFVIEVLQIMLIAALIVVPIRIFLIYPFIVKGASMEPNFYNNEYLIVDELTYRFRDPARGEIVVFRPPPPHQGDFFIKRIVGLPGEEVEIRDGGVVIYNAEHPNGILLEEPYIVHDDTTGVANPTLGPNEYFLLGDNRDESLDSRSIGPIKRRDVVGRVWIRGLPLSRFSLFPLPAYNLE